MVRNDPRYPFQRRNIVDRVSSSYAIKSRLIGAVHGYISARTEQPASLLVLSFRFLPYKRNVRIKSVNITVEFEGDDDDPAVAAIAPDDKVNVFENITEETTRNGIGINTGNAGIGLNAELGLNWERTIVAQGSSAVVLPGYKSVKSKSVGEPNVVNWNIVEDPIVKAGVPPYLQTAILLERSTDKIFKANINVKADLSGFSFRNLQDGILESEDDPVIFDPSAYPLMPSELRDVDIHSLGSIDLSQLYRVRNVIDNEDITRRGTIRQAVRDIFSKDETLDEKVDEKSESWFIDLWDNNTAVDARNVLPKKLDRDHLAEYFSWISETPNTETPAPITQAEREGQPAQRQQRHAQFCNLIFSKLESLLNEPSVALLSDFFDLPDDFEISRRHDRGGCQVFDNKEGDKDFKLYIIQTPFYSTGFWSLLLYSMADSSAVGESSKLSGVIQADVGVDLRNIFHDVRNLVDRHGHHQTLLPVQLFKSHYEATLAAFNSIQTDVAIVDDELLKQFKDESKMDDASKLYRHLSMTLHMCSMNLAELGRRREFEEEFGSKLQKDLESDSKLKVVVEIYSRMSKSRDSDIESLPGKIESQRNVLFNLITQHDSSLQARLARESLRDSKAMKTLSILTILFLPGAFIATVFSTEMFDFKSKDQQVRIYFAITIPLTAVLMICWVLWLKNTPERDDVESVRPYRPFIPMNWTKGGKED
ncbi:unnamed protein product [Fusarium venenatum]|uniref:Uncharacterized protein n=1 Tax=Fusarium venenatum TaxID=56646 RepID=A0A2L2TK63_9HYPO|nr:uncharacterized protein FVRRES_10595 [Fusarium venenatum]CEI70518.1 unnamed protein product [Fusarium venenatum]